MSIAAKKKPVDNQMVARDNPDAPSLTFEDYLRSARALKKPKKKVYRKRKNRNA